MMKLCVIQKHSCQNKGHDYNSTTSVDSTGNDGQL